MSSMLLRDVHVSGLWHVRFDVTVWASLYYNNSHPNSLDGQPAGSFHVKMTAEPFPWSAQHGL